MPSQGDKEKKAAEWIYKGGGGLEIARGDEKCLAMYWAGIVSLLEDYGEYIREEDAKIADERARIMNVLGSDAKMIRKLTHAEIQSERVLEAKTIAAAIRRGKP